MLREVMAEFEQQVEMENEGYLVSSPWQSAIETYLACRRSVSPLSSEEILTNAIEKPLERQTRGDQMQVASILKDLGWEKYRDCQNGKRQYKWRKPNLS